MATILALDWDRQRVHLVAGATGARGAVQFHKAMAWDEPEDLTPATAEAVGKRLKQRLKDEHITATSVLICLGRERVVFKEIRIPIVGPAEEPAIVRFQASKELTESPDSVVIDYCPLHGLGGDGERRALLLLAPRTLVDACKKLCTAAGLKLEAITPRPFGVTACLQAADAPPQRGLAVAVLTVSERWAEFAIVGSKQLLFARSVPPQGNLLGEVRRNLALYAGQPVHSSRDPVQGLYLAGGAEALRRELHDALAIPVRVLDPLPEHLQVEDRAGFTGAAGLLHAWSDGERLPVNFAAPKEPKPVVGVNREKLVLAAGVGFLSFIAMIFFGMLLTSAQSHELDQKKILLDEAESTLKRLQPESKQITALKDWQKGALPILDELHDLTMRFPYRVGFYVDELNLSPLVGDNKEAYSMRLMLVGHVPKGEVRLVQQFIDTINRDKHCRATLVSLREASSGSDDRDSERFSIRVDLAPPTANVATKSKTVGSQIPVTGGKP